ncbi:hypothetical protein NAI72_11955, partial [Francisella tularensis subsp. holarctica]|nr:hypothetical protein [Francisella tularensis subsp. holarctica]
NEYCIETKIELPALDDSSNQLSPKQYTINVCSKQGRLAAIDKAVEIFYSQINDAESIYYKLTIKIFTEKVAIIPTHTT